MVGDGALPVETAPWCERLLPAGPPSRRPPGPPLAGPPSAPWPPGRPSHWRGTQRDSLTCTEGWTHGRAAAALEEMDGEVERWRGGGWRVEGWRVEGGREGGVEGGGVEGGGREGGRGGGVQGWLMEGWLMEGWLM